ncbi:MAG TPA: hypothetical protein VF941_13140 [Clostridia bacterium]
MRGFRRQYIENRVPDKAPEKAPVPETSTNSSASTVSSSENNIGEFLKSMEDLKKSLKATEEKLDLIDTRLRKTETDLQKTGRLFEADFLCIKNEFEAIKEVVKKERRVQYQPSCEYVDRPVMPGSGFACITPGYLRNMQNR